MIGPLPSAAARAHDARRHGRARRNDRARTLVALVSLLAALALLLGACGGGSSLLSGSESQAGGPAGAPAEVPAAAPGQESEAGEDAARDGATFRAADNADGSVAALAGGPLIVRTGQLDLEVGVLEDALAAAEKAVTAAGGYVAASQRSGDDERASATVTYRVPVERWEATLVALRAVGTKVLAEQTASEEVTSQVIDLGARLANLRATEAALQEIMTKATKIPDVLEVQAQLTSVRQEIEQLAAQKLTLEQRAAFATLTVGFSPPPVVAVTQVREGWDPAAEVDRAAATLVGAGQALLNAAIWVAIVVLPLALLLGACIAAAWLLARRLRKSSAVSGPAPTDAPAA